METPESLHDVVDSQQRPRRRNRARADKRRPDCHPRPDARGFTRNRCTSGANQMHAKIFYRANRAIFAHRRHHLLRLHAFQSGRFSRRANRARRRGSGAAARVSQPRRRRGRAAWRFFAEQSDERRDGRQAERNRCPAGGRRSPRRGRRIGSRPVLRSRFDRFAEQKVSIVYPKDRSSQAISELLEHAKTDILFIGDPGTPVDPGARMFDRMSQVMRETGAGWVYADAAGHPHIDYQPGSIRDTFDLGPVTAISTAAARRVGIEPGLRWGGLYDLRLRISEAYPIVRIPEALYSFSASNSSGGAHTQFSYVDPRNRDYQLEMERIATAHLRRIGAWLPPAFKSVPAPDGDFSVKASVIIPVRNRERTILDAVRSALAQQADFSFNVIVVDNHSTDRTPELLRSVGDSRLRHITPDRADLGIGGCWNEAIYSPDCGRYCVQLDSDDLYANERVLRRIVEVLESGPYAMVVGAYTLVDFSLREIPP